jgi:hypothetical protein
MHAVERGLANNLDQEDIIRIVREGVKEQEGKSKCRYILKTRRETLVAVCDEDNLRVIVITVTKGGV